MLLVACGNRREDVCPACSQVYKNDARQIIRSGLTGGKGIPDSVAAHPCVFATLTAPSFGPVHTTRTGRAGRPLACRPRRDAHQRRCPHGRDISCPRHHRDGDPRLGQPLCPDCYDYTGHILFNALGPEVWRRFTIYLPRQLARLAGVTQKRLRSEVTVRFVKVAEYQARGVVHYHAVIRLDADGNGYQPPPAQYTAALLCQAIQRAASVVSCDTIALVSQAIRGLSRRSYATQRRLPLSTLAWGVFCGSGPRSTQGSSATPGLCPAPARRCLRRRWRTTSPNTPPRPSAPPDSPTVPCMAPRRSTRSPAASTTSG